MGERHNHRRIILRSVDILDYSLPMYSIPRFAAHVPHDWARGAAVSAEVCAAGVERGRKKEGDCDMSLDRFDFIMSTEYASPPERYPRMSDSGMFCLTCGRELKRIEYPDEEQEYAGGSYTVYGGSEYFCPRGCE